MDPLTDFLLSHHGTLWLLIPRTPRAEEWCALHLADAVQPPWGGAVVVEHRDIEEIALGIVDDGLSITSSLEPDRPGFK
jgi:hypothetical protein